MVKFKKYLKNKFFALLGRISVSQKFYMYKCETTTNISKTNFIFLLFYGECICHSLQRNGKACGEG